MEIACPRCGAMVAGGDVNPVTGLARCAACNEVFRFTPADGHAPPPPRELPPGEAPRGITLSQNGHEQTLRYRWRSSRTVMITLWSVAWTAGMAFALSRHGPRVGTGVRALVTAFLAVGLLVAYWALAEWANTTTFTLRGGWLRVRHGPVPWPGSADVPAAAIRQLYSHDFQMRQEHGGNSHQYSVRALLRDGTTTTLLSNLKSPAATWYIERRLEAWLGLADEPVADEMSRAADASYVSW
jgi:hypothetical protein